MTRSTVALALLALVAPTYRAQELGGGAATLAPSVAEELAAAVDELARQPVERGLIAGVSISVELEGERVVEDGWGLADVENSVPATADTVYRIGSVTKQFTSALTMMLVESGQLELDLPLQAFLPDFPTGGRTVTIEHLLTHTSGIKSYTSLRAFWEKIPLELSHEQLLDLFEDEPFEFEPGAAWNYNNSGYYLLGMILERVTGKDYGELIEAELTAPLGMSSTRYGHVRPIVPNRARGYDATPDGLVNAQPMGMNAPGAAGALLSTVGDLLTWQRALSEHRIVSAEGYARMCTPVMLSDGSTHDYGYGLEPGELDGHRRIAHGGGINGFTAQLSTFPDDGLTVAVLVNTASPEASRLAQEIARAAFALLAAAR